MTVFVIIVFYNPIMNINRAIEIIDEINTKREFIATTLAGFGENNYKTCKVFMGTENLSIYLIEPKLILLKEFPNKEVEDVKLYPMEENIEIPNTKSTIGRGLLGFLIGDWVGAFIGMATTVFPEYITKDVYNMSIITKSGTVCLQVNE